MRRLIFAILTILISFSSAMLLAEIALRIVWTPPTLRSTPMAEAHPYYRVAPRPGVSGKHYTSEYETSFSHTSQGLRGEILYERKLPDGIRKRILFLGDSFTYGEGSSNDEAFVARLDKNWPDIEIVNTGFSGYGQREELAVLDQLGAALRPDLSVVVFFWNDLSDNLTRNAPAFQLDQAGFVQRTDLEIAADFDPLASRVAVSIDENARVLQTSFLKRLYKGGIRGLRYRLFGIRPRLPTNSQEYEAGWILTKNYLAMLSRRAEEFGSDFVVISIPGQSRVDPGARIAGIEPLAFEIEEKLASVCAELNIPYIDLLPDISAAHELSESPLYYFADRHLTPLGNGVVANALSGKLATLVSE